MHRLPFSVISISLAGCRRNRNLNSNGTSQTSSVPGSEEAKRQAQSLVEKGKELYGNNQDEQAVEVNLQKAIQSDRKRRGAPCAWHGLRRARQEG
jgi:hypothetical protein